MVLVLEREYCDGSAGCSCGAGGAGHLVSETRHVDAVTWYTTDHQYYRRIAPEFREVRRRWS